MNYKEKYEMALEGIQEILGSGEDSIKMSRLKLRLQGIFPELIAEDEKIKKDVKRAISVALDYSYFDKETANNCLAWLEKQDEQKSTNIRTTGYWNVQEVEQKPAWSEDDKKYLRRAINATRNGYPEINNWLKSLKDRYTWKPSDEQIKVCKEVYADLLSAKGFDVGAINSELNRLEEQLKKLMEE